MRADREQPGQPGSGEGMLSGHGRRSLLKLWCPANSALSAAQCGYPIHWTITRAARRRVWSAIGARGTLTQAMPLLRRPIAREISRCASRVARSCRLSYAFLPFASPSSTFA